jgi:hypothetical protein
MGRVFRPRKEANEYSAKAGDTFESIVAQKCEKADPAITCDEVALFNWATREPLEVQRALSELIGCRKIDPNPYKSELDPARGANKKLYLPKVWKKEGLAYEKKHKLVVKQSQPANAIRIEKLSKWFLPKFEACDLDYGLEGLKKTASKVALEVWSSNYCEAKAVPDGGLFKFQYTALDLPVFQKDLKSAGQADERAKPSVTDYKGESTATKGILKKRGKDERFLTAANSPYTLNLKYYKQDSDKHAHIAIGDFWPQFDNAGNVDTTSLVLKWKAKDCSRMQAGLLQVYDGQDNLVWWKGLAPGDFTNGDHQFDWKTWVAASAYAVTTAKMPYRVQIQGHTPVDEANGLAVAAMQTEVRIFQNDTIGTKPAAQRHTEPQCLELSLAPFLPVRTVDSPKKDVLPSDGSKKWVKLKLNEAGYHAGPAHENTDSDHLKLALAEFQRCVPSNNAAPFKRMTADGKVSKSAKDGLKAVAAAHRRALFATTARADQTLVQAGPVLNQPLSDLILWVEDRHYYTKISATIKKGLPDKKLALEDYGGDMSMTDANRQTLENKTVARPWIPLQAKIPLLTKADALLATGASVPNFRPEMLEATGPLRVDWKFTDMAPDYTPIDNANYNSDGRNVTRTRRFIRETMNTAIGGATHNGIPVGNCPTANGGIRSANYHRDPFGLVADSLAPWRAVEDPGEKSVCTLVHDDLDQKSANVHPTHYGYAGVYFHPSRIAGDGYRLQANVNLKKHPGAGEDHPNRAVLERRYRFLPQGHSCTLRLWRKTMFRGYSEWSTANPIAYATFSAHTAHQYEAAFVQFAHEGNAPQVHILPMDPAAAADVTKYKKIIEAGMKRGGNRARYPSKTLMRLSRANHWPYLNQNHYGIPWRLFLPFTRANFRKNVLNKVLNDTIYNYSDNLMFELLYRIERATGHFSGHFSVLWEAVPQLWTRNYICNAAGAHVVLVPERTQAEQAANGTKCPTCAGVLQTGYVKYYQCANGHNFRRTEATVADVNPPCPTCGAACGPNPVPQVPAHGSDDVIKFGIPGFSEPAIGQALGTLWLYFDTTLTGNGNRMAHEYGHNRHLEHTPSVDPAAGYDPTQHDTAVNSVTAFTAAEVAGLYNQWDHRCMMSYCPDPTPGGDKDPLRYFCGKCALKHRGWGVTALALPGGGLADP